MATMRVGTASVNWGFDPLYDWTVTPPFTRLLDEMVETGYTGTEISYHFPADLDLLRTELSKRGLKAAATFHETRLLDPAAHATETARAQAAAERLQALDSDVLILADHTTPRRLKVAGRVASDGSDGLDQQGWQALATGLNRIGQMLRDRGMRGVFHPHVGTYVETRAEIDRLCQLTDPALIGLCLDTGHLAYAGVDPEDVFVDYAPRVWYVHLKDVDAAMLEQVRREHRDFAAAVKMGLFVPLGDGMVNMERIFNALKDAAYDGWIIVEQDAPADPLAAARRSRAYLRDRFGL